MTASVRTLDGGVLALPGRGSRIEVRRVVQESRARHVAVVDRLPPVQRQRQRVRFVHLRAAKIGPMRVDHRRVRMAARAYDVMLNVSRAMCRCLHDTQTSTSMAPASNCAVRVPG